MTRLEFEAYLKAEPFSLNVDRWPDDAVSHEERFAWPGQYEVYAVQLAWEVLQEALRRQQERT
jgi:hypothetical protein